jgi:hypothetical protein
MSSTTNHKVLYGNFLKDQRLYGQVESYWNRHVLEVLNGMSISPKKWIENTYANGRKIRNGNPIYNAILNPGRAVRIIQEAPEEVYTGMEIEAWLDNTQDIDGNELKELVISLELTKETKNLAIQLIKYWANEKTTEKQMQHAIASLDDWWYTGRGHSQQEKTIQNKNYE